MTCHKPISVALRDCCTPSEFVTITNTAIAELMTGSPKHMASRHYLSSDLSAFNSGLGLQAF